MYDVTKFRTKTPHLYYQYRSVQALEDLFICLEKRINSNYFEFLNEALESMSPKHSRSDYLAFWSVNLLGLYKPLGAAALNVFYDTEEKYDGNLKFDDSEVYDGTISLEMFKQYLQFILNYSRPIINLDTFTSFISKQIGCEKREIIIQQDSGGITLRVPQTQGSSDFLKLLNSYYNDLGLPFGVKLDVRYKDDVNG